VARPDGHPDKFDEKLSLRPDVIRTNFPKFSLYPDAWSGQDLRIKVLPDGESGHM